MYPRLSDLTRDLFGFALPLPIYSFGAMVAVAILTAAWLLGKEFDRKHALGLMPAINYPEKDPKTGRDDRAGHLAERARGPPRHDRGRLRASRARSSSTSSKTSTTLRATRRG